MSGRLRLAAAAVAVVGLAIAGYLTAVHYSGGEPVCAISHGCATVQQSAYADLAGIPVAVLGLAGYVAILASLVRDGERERTATAFLALAGFGFSAWLTYVEVVRLDAICIWCVGLGDLHDAAGRAVGGADGQRAAASAERPAGVSEKTAGADVPQSPSGPQSGPAVEWTQPRATASSIAQVSASRSGPRRRAWSASSVAGPPRRALEDVVGSHGTSVANPCDDPPVRA